MWKRPPKGDPGRLSGDYRAAPSGENHLYVSAASGDFCRWHAGLPGDQLVLEYRVADFGKIRANRWIAWREPAFPARLAEKYNDFMQKTRYSQTVLPGLRRGAGTCSNNVPGGKTALFFFGVGISHGGDTQRRPSEYAGRPCSRLLQQRHTAVVSEMEGAGAWLRKEPLPHNTPAIQAAMLMETSFQAGRTTSTAAARYCGHRLQSRKPNRHKLRNNSYQQTWARRYFCPGLSYEEKWLSTIVVHKLATYHSVQVLENKAPTFPPRQKISHNFKSRF